MGNTDDMLGVTSFPEMDYKLGEPKGPAAETEEGVWRRDFASGAFVIWVSPGFWFGCSMVRRSVKSCWTCRTTTRRMGHTAFRDSPRRPACSARLYNRAVSKSHSYSFAAEPPAAI